MLSKNKIKLLEVNDEWISHLNKNYSSRVAEEYQIAIQKFLEWYFDTDNFQAILKRYSLPKISVEDIENWIIKLSKEGYGFTMVRRYRGAIVQFLQFINERFNVNDMLKVTDISLPVEIENFDALTDSEIRDIVEYAETLRDKLIILLLYETGMRRQEIIDFKKEHINFNNNTVIVNGFSGERVIPITEELSQFLLNYIREWKLYLDQINNQRVERAIKKHEKQKPLLKESEYLFQTLRSPQISSSTIHNVIKHTTYEYFYRDAILEGSNAKKAEELAKKKADIINPGTLRNSRKAYLFAQEKNIDEIMYLMDESNKWICNRFKNVADNLYQ